MTARSARLALAGGCAAVLALAACSSGPPANGPAPAAPGSSGSPAAGSPSPAAPAGGSSGAVIPGQPGAPPRIEGGLSPGQLVAAYDTGPLYSRGITGKGQTIVIVDPFGSPTIERDLAAYDKAWHLPAPPSFRVIAPAGPVPPFRPIGARTGAAIETTLDVESAHLLAPSAGILLVETPTAETEGRRRLPGDRPGRGVRDPAPPGQRDQHEPGGHRAHVPIPRVDHGPALGLRRRVQRPEHDHPGRGQR